MKKEILTQDKVLICMIEHKESKQTTIAEAKYCYDAVCDMIKKLQVENLCDDELHVGIDDIMSHTMRKNSLFSLGLDGKTIRIRPERQEEINNSYKLPGWIRNVIYNNMEKEYKVYQKRRNEGI